MFRNQHVGMRYVPKVEKDQWTKDKEYENLIVVPYQGNSYTSRKAVPIGIEITNTDFWTCTGNYNAQLQIYIEMVEEYINSLTDYGTRITGVETNLSKKMNYGNEYPIEFYGGKADDISFDNYDAYMLAVNDPKCCTVVLGKGKYYFSKIPLYNQFNIIGQGMLNTEIIAMQSSNTGFIYLNKGPVAYNLYKGFKVTGNKNNANQTGFYLYGTGLDDTPYHGGFWCNIMQDIHISNFTNCQLHMEGVDPRSSALMPNQFNTLINVRAFGDSNAKNVCELWSQNGQTLMLNCQFDSATTSYYNLHCKGVDLHADLLTCQHSDNGFYQEGGCITLTHPWFEVCKNPFYTNNSGTSFGGSLVVNGGTFRNCGVDVGSRICKTSSRSIIDIRNVMFMGSQVQTVFENDNDEISNITTDGLFFSLGYVTMYSKTYNLISANANNELKINTNKMCYVASGTVTNVILGNYNPCLKELYMFALSGAGVVFSGSNFINPQTVAGNKYFKLNLIDSKWLITVLN